MRKRWLKLAAIPLAFTLAASACSTEDEAAEDTGESGTTAAESDTTTAGSGTASPGTGTTTGGTGTTTAETGDTTAGTPGGTIPADPALEGTEVTVFGSESSEEEAGAMQDALDIFAERNGMEITFVGARDFEQQINSQVTGGNPPDIAIFPARQGA